MTTQKTFQFQEQEPKKYNKNKIQKQNWKTCFETTYTKKHQHCRENNVFVDKQKPKQQTQSNHKNKSEQNTRNKANRAKQKKRCKQSKEENKKQLKKRQGRSRIKGGGPTSPDSKPSPTKTPKKKHRTNQTKKDN